MKNIFKISIILSIFAMFSTSISAAELLHSYGAIKAGYADWDVGFDDEERGNLFRIGFEHGSVYDTGDFWFLIEHNKIDSNTEKQNFTMGAVGNYKIFNSNVTLFSKLWNKDENTIGDKFDMSLGFGYSGFNFENGFFKPFVAIASISTDFTSPEHGSANGFNGFTAGWQTGYNFILFNQKMSIVNAHEFLINRNDGLTYSPVARGHKSGLTGTLTLNWKIYEHIGARLNYTYYLNDNGFDGYGDQLAYLITYTF